MRPAWGEGLDPALPQTRDYGWRFGVRERHRFYRWCASRGFHVDPRWRAEINTYFNAVYGQRWDDRSDTIVDTLPNPAAAANARPRAVYNLRRIFAKLAERRVHLPPVPIYVNYAVNSGPPTACFYDERRALGEGRRLASYLRRPIYTLSITGRHEVPPARRIPGSIRG